MASDRHRIVLDVSPEQHAAFKRLHEDYKARETSSIAFNPFLKDALMRLAVKVAPVSAPLQPSVVVKPATVSSAVGKPEFSAQDEYGNTYPEAYRNDPVRREQMDRGWAILRKRDGVTS